MHTDHDTDRRTGNLQKGRQCEHGKSYQQGKKEIRRMYTMPFAGGRMEKSWWRGENQPLRGQRDWRILLCGRTGHQGLIRIGCH